MNALGISLAWNAVQVTLFCLIGTGVYLIARRRLRSGASVLCGILIMTWAIAAVSVSPWPRWWTADFRLPASSLEPMAAAPPVDEQASSARASAADAADKSGLGGRDSVVQEAIQTLLSGVWKRVRKELADPPTSEKVEVGWRWPAWLAAAILSGMVIGLARVVLGFVAMAKLLRGTRLVVDSSLLCLVEQLRARLDCHRLIEVREMTCSGGGSPAVVGWRRPVILLPANWRTWSAEARQGILAHETAHVAHGDVLMWLAAQAGVIAHFYNPLVHWLAQRLRLEQELAADACGAALAGGPKAYATILAQTALRQDEFQPLWAGRPFFPTRGTLMRRIEMLNHRTVIARNGPARHGRTVLLTTLALVGLGVSGVRGPNGRMRAGDPATADNTVKAEEPTSFGLLPAFDDSYLPAGTIAVMSVKPLRVAGSSAAVEPCLLSFPSSFGFAFSTADNGVDEVKTIAFSAAPNDGPSHQAGDSPEPPLLEIYRMRKPYERDKLRVKLFGEAPDGVTETTCHGYSCFSAISDISGLLLNYLLVDDRTIVILRDRDVPRVLAADSQSHPSWYGEWQKIAGSPLAVACDSAAMAAIEEKSEDAQDAQDMFIRSLLHETTFIFAQVACASGELKISATARCASPEKALAVTNVVQTGATGLTTALTTVPQIFEKSSMPTEFQSVDVAGTLVRTLSELKMNRQEREVQAEIKFDAPFVTQVAEATKALVARQSEELKARDEQDEQAHVAKLGRLAAAFNAYHDEHGSYPPAAVMGKDGKTLHSWRVELLPYLGEKELFETYKLDEPWDSEHNQPLVAKIPDIYSTSVWTQKGNADYFVITGKGTLFDPAAPARRDSVVDAAGETLLVLQSQQRIPWTKPMDIETTAEHDARRPFRGHGKGFYAAFADGTVRFVSQATDPASVRAMFTKAGGDEVRLR
jgi:beta-lactamase regulating signal transducer with metallopeptidase domain